MRRTLAVYAALVLAAALAAAEAPTPQSFLGHRVGEDRRLAPWPKVLEYLRLVAAASDRVTIEVAGSSTLGNEMPVVVMTSAANQGALERYRDIAHRLANGDTLDEQEAEQLIAEGKAIVLVSCTIHSTEVGSTQMAMELAYQFATTQEPERLRWMDDVVLLVMPSINPDGQVMVIDWYERTLGTPYEGGPMPWLYHPYVGHDDNRDYYMLTQKETRVVNDVLYRRWFPQVFLDEHQMGSTGPRMFVPPQTDPLALEVSSLIFRQADLFGTNMSYRLEEAGKLGVGHDMIFDSYWPGGTRNTAWWKNVTGMLTEVASARVASPIYVDPGELRGGVKGLPEYGRRSNYPSPWPGGWWRLRDIVDYELVATWSVVETASRYRQDLLRNVYRMSREATAAGRDTPPHAWIVEPEQHDPTAAALLVELLLRHGVRVYQAADELVLGRVHYPPGTVVIPAAQPYRAFLLTMLMPQRYPEVLPYTDGPVLAPYDVTSWSLPISMGVDVVAVDRPTEVALLPMAAPAWPGGPVESGAGGYLLSHAADSVYTVMNRLLAAGKELFWLDAAPAGGRRGDIFVPAEAVSAEEMGRLSSELHVEVRPLAERPAGDAYRVSRPRVGLYKPWVASMDEGWTRWLLERYELPFVNLTNEEIRAGDLRRRLDVLLLPDVEKSVIDKGVPESDMARRTRALPPEYAGGLDRPGGEAIRAFVAAGGTVVALDSASDYLIDLLELPIEDVLAGVPRDRFNCPGSMLRLLVDTSHPLGFGLRPEEAGYFADSPAFRTHLPDARLDRWVVARYPEHDDEILVSGYLEGADRLERLAAVVELTLGKGRVVLFGLRPQHRAQTHRTFKMLFNALYLPGLERTRL